MSKGTLTLYFDAISPFSYIAFEALMQFESKLNLNLKFKPVSIGQIFKSSSNKPPALCPAKAKYVHADLLLLSKYWNVPFKHVSNFNERVLNGNTSKVQRFLTAVSLYQSTDLQKLMRGFWLRFYFNDKDIYSQQDIIEVCNQLQIENVDKLIALSNSEEVKNAYKEATNEAIEQGAFGLPWMYVELDGRTGYRLFGTDRIHVLLHELNVPFNGPLTLAKL